jgi:mycofactocin precursor
VVQILGEVKLLPSDLEIVVEVSEDQDALLEADLLLEDVSIDGICGVY